MGILGGAFALRVGLSCAYWLLGARGFVKSHSSRRKSTQPASPPAVPLPLLR